MEWVFAVLDCKIATGGVKCSKVVNRYKNFKENHEILPIHFMIKVLKKLENFYKIILSNSI